MIPFSLNTSMQIIYTCRTYWERSTASFLSFTVTHTSLKVVTTSASPLLHSAWVRGLFLTHTLIRFCLCCLQFTQSNHRKEENAVPLNQQWHCSWKRNSLLFILWLKKKKKQNELIQKLWWIKWVTKELSCMFAVIWIILWPTPCQKSFENWKILSFSWTRHIQGDGNEHCSPTHTHLLFGTGGELSGSP